MSGVNVYAEREMFYVGNTTIRRDEDGSCTASAVIRGKQITLTYAGAAICAEDGTASEAKPWLHDVRRDLCVEFVRQYGSDAHFPKLPRKATRKAKDPLAVDCEFLNLIRDRIGLDVVKGNKGAYTIGAGNVVAARVKLNKTRKVDLCRRLAPQMPDLREIQKANREVEGFFAEFSIA